MKPLPLRVPELVPGLDVRKLPLGAIEGFVLSRVDGRAALTDIVAMTGLGIDQVAPIVEKLVSLGAVRWTGDAAAKPAQAGAAPAGARPTPGAKPVTNATPVSGARPVSTTNPPFTAGPPSGAPTGSRARVPSFPSLPPTPGSQASTHATASRTPSSPSVPPAAGSRPPSSASHPPAGAARRRTQSGQSGPPRRVMAESTISQAPPDFRVSQRPGSGAPPSRPPTKRPPEGASKPPAEGAPADPVKALFDAVAEEERANKADVSDRPPAPEAKVAMNPGPLSQPVLTAAMMDVDLPYDPTELMEQVDLPVERRKEVLDLYYRLEHLDHYEILGIAYDADKKDVRAAYFSLSKVFHPDTMFRKNLGSFKAKMELVFSRLTEAYDTLGKKKARDEYDRYLQATKRTQMAERALVFETRREEARVAKAQVQIEVPPLISQRPPAAAPSPLAPSAPAQPSVPPREISDESRRLAQQIMQRRLRSVVGPSPKQPASPQPNMQSASKPPPAPSTPPGTRTDPQELLRRLTRTLKDVGAVTGTSDQLTRHVKASQAAFARGDVAEAAKLMQRAVSIAPEREDLRAEFDKMSKMLSEKLAAAYEEQARFEQKANKWASAALSWVKVCEGKPQDAVAHRMAAQALFKAGGDLRGAQKYAQQAVFLAPDDIEGHLLLAQLYLTIGLKLNAKRELDAASKLDPENEMVKNLLADMKS